MTAALTIALTAALLLAAWLLGQFPMAAKRLIVALVATGIGAGIVQIADRNGADDTIKTAISIACGIGALALAWWTMQPWLWGIEDWLAERDAQDEVQP